MHYYVTKNKYQAKDDATWYFEDNKYQADKKIYWENNKNRADILVYETSNKNSTKGSF